MKCKQKFSVLKRTIGTLALFLVLIFHANTSHALISNGADAIDLLGQYDGTSLEDPQPYYEKGGPNDGPNKLGFDQTNAATGGIITDTTNHRLFITDSSNHRVLIYNLNNDNTLSDRIPDYVLGQADFFSRNTNQAAATLSNPQSLAYDSINNRLFVSQTNRSKVFVFDVSTIENGEPAINVLGSTSFTSLSSGTTQSRLNRPRGLTYDNQNERLFVADSNNNRVMIFDVAEITNGENAVNVLGQANFTSKVGATTQTGLDDPYGLEYDNDNNRLFILDNGNNRLLVHDVNTETLSNNQAADYVLGQANFTSGNSQNTQSGFNNPRDVVYDNANDLLFVSHNSRNVVTVYDISTIENGEDAINILGKTSYTSGPSGGDITQSKLFSPLGLSYDPTNKFLYVLQGANGNRVSIFDVTEITNGENAINLLGQYQHNSLIDPQPNYTQSGTNNSPNNLGFDGPFDTALDSINHRLFVADRDNNRIFIYNLNNDNTLPDKIPDYVLGQTDFYSNTQAFTQSKFSSISALAYDDIHNRLFVTDNNRILVFDVTEITNGENAVNVLGQTNFTSNTAATTQSGLNNSNGLAYDKINQRLFVAGGSLRRVMVFDVNEITNGEDAINVLGQTNFTSNIFEASQSGLVGARDVAYDHTSNRLFVTCTNRVLVYDVSEITNGENAINVLGQTTFETITSGNTQSTFNGANHLAHDPLTNRLFVSQSGNISRVLAFDVNEITNGEDAINVIGYPDFTSSGQEITRSSLSNSYGLTIDPLNNRLFVSQATTGNRISIFDIGQAGFIVTETDDSTAVSEDGVTDTFSVVLTAAPPDEDVILDITSSQAAAASVTPASLTFTSENWDTPQTVTVEAPEDDNAYSETETLTISINDANSDDGFDDLEDQTISVSVTDNDVPGITVTQSNNSTDATEGETDTYTIILISEPLQDVTITLTDDDQGAVDNSLTFTSENWDTPQTVTVIATDDDVDEDDHTSTISHTVSSDDNQYDNFILDNITLNITDNDTAGVTITETDGTTSATEGTTDTYNIVLNSDPTENVTITINTDANSSTDQNSLIFTSENWNTSQEITLTAANNDIDEPNYTSTITHGIDSEDNKYNVLILEDIILTVIDNDTAGTTITESNNSTDVIEGGSDTYTLVLNSEPTQNVAISINHDDNSIVTPTLLNFTSENWDTPQTVTISTLSNQTVDGNRTSEITHQVTSNDNYYDALNVQDIILIIIDNDTIGGSAIPFSLIPQTPNQQTISFSDLDSDHWAHEYVETLYKMGIIDGRTEETFAPNNTITRAELTKIAINIFDYELSTTTLPFSDVAIDHWGYQYIATAYAQGFIQGYNDNTFQPDAPINRVEALKILLAAGQVDFNQNNLETTQLTFNDIEKNAWYMPYLKYSVLQKIIDSVQTNNQVRPGANITRAEVAKIAILIYEML